MMIRPGQLVAGDYFLVEADDYEYAFWRFEEGPCDTMLVDWDGDPDRHTWAEEFRLPTSYHAEWVGEIFKLHLIHPENVDGIIMAARHMNDAEQWYRFARRQAERQHIENIEDVR